MIGIASTNRRFFTLFEMLIVMLLIAICFSTLAIQVPKALKKERFETDVEAVILKIMLAQELILDHFTDVTLILTEHKGGIRCKLKADQPLPKKIKAKIEKETLLSQIQKIGFEEKQGAQIELHFEGTLGVTPRGTLVLEGEKEKANLILRGYPSKILREEYNFGQETPPPYPEEILSAL